MREWRYPAPRSDFPYCLASSWSALHFTFSFWRYEELTETATIELDVPLDDAVTRCVRVMNASRLRSVEVLTDPCRSVSGHTRPSIRPLGPHCSIEITQAGEASLLVCRCSPRPELVLTDWGARHSVLQRLVECISAPSVVPETATCTNNVV